MSRRPQPTAPPEWRPSDAAVVQFVLLSHFHIARRELLELREGAAAAGLPDAAKAFNIALNVVIDQYEVARARGVALQGGGAPGARRAGTGGPVSGPPWTHAQLVELAAAWLYRRGCGYVFREYGVLAEKPDALGFLGPLLTVLIEVKVSRADFRADAKKPWRREPATGVGDWRYYLAPRGLLSPADLPERWGLLEVHGAGQIRQVCGPRLKGDGERTLLIRLRQQVAAGVAPECLLRNEEAVRKILAWGDELDALQFPEKNGEGELVMLHSALSRLALKGCFGILKTGMNSRVSWTEEVWGVLPGGGYGWVAAEQAGRSSGECVNPTSRTPAPSHFYSDAMTFPNLVLVDENNGPMVGTGVVLVNADGTCQDANSDTAGEVDASIVPGSPVEAWVTSEGYRAVQYRPGSDSHIRMTPLPQGGSLVIEGTGYIPNLGGHTDEDGRLNPIRGDFGSILYLKNVAFNGQSSAAPHNFKFSEPFTLRDGQGREFEVTILDHAGQRFLVEYQRTN